MNNTYFVVLVLLLFFLYFFLEHHLEKFSGDVTENVFSKLACITDKNGNEHVFKIDDSKNIKDANNNPYKTIHALIKPYKKGDANINRVVKSDFLDSGDSIVCDEANFSTYYVKKLRDPNSKTKQLFNLYNASWQNQECTLSDIKDTNHWCNKVFNAINDDPVLCDTKNFKHNPPKYCMEFPDVKNFAKSDDKTKGPIVNNLKVSGRPCPDACAVSSGRIPDSYVDPNTKSLVCLTDEGLKDGKCTGTNLFSIMNGKIIDSYSPNCKKCANRATNQKDRDNLSNIPDTVWSFNECLKKCAT